MFVKKCKRFTKILYQQIVFESVFTCVIVVKILALGIVVFVKMSGITLGISLGLELGIVFGKRLT